MDASRPHVDAVEARGLGRGSAGLRWAFGASIGLTLIAALTAVIELEQARTEVRILSRTADRSSFLVGQAGRYLSRLRAIALERLRSSSAPDPDAQFAEVQRALDRTLAELRPLLKRTEQERWTRFLPLVKRFRRDLRASMAAARAGDLERAGAILTRVGAPADALQRDLDELSALNQRESRRILSTADNRLVAVGLVQTVVLLVLAVGLTLIWLAVLRGLDRHEHQLLANLAAVEQSNRDLDAFAGRVAHDLRNALAPLMLLPATLQAAARRPEAVLQIAARVQRMARVSRDLIDGLLAFARAGQVDGQNASVRACLEELVEETRPNAAANAVELVADLDDCDVECSHTLLRVVCSNLIDNAIKHMVGRDVRRLEITSRRLTDGCEVTVADTGPGIPSHALSRIFEPFFRVPGGQTAGTGIGLATVHRIVESHGGEVSVESAVGVGSTFRVRLRSVAPAGEPDAPPAAEAGRERPFHGA